MTKSTFQNYLQIIQESKINDKYHYAYEEGKTFDDIYEIAASIVTTGTFALFPALLAATLISNGITNIAKITKKQLEEVKKEFINKQEDKDKAKEYVTKYSSPLNPEILKKVQQSLKKYLSEKINENYSGYRKYLTTIQESNVEIINESPAALIVAFVLLFNLAVDKGNFPNEIKNLNNEKKIELVKSTLKSENVDDSTKEKLVKILKEKPEELGLTDQETYTIYQDIDNTPSGVLAKIKKMFGGFFINHAAKAQKELDANNKMRGD